MVDNLGAPPSLALYPCSLSEKQPPLAPVVSVCEALPDTLPFIFLQRASMQRASEPLPEALCTARAPLDRLDPPAFYPLLARDASGSLILVKSYHFLDINGDLVERARADLQAPEALIPVVQRSRRRRCRVFEGGRMQRGPAGLVVWRSDLLQTLLCRTACCSSAARDCAAACAPAVSRTFSCET